jgi:hypothetical protein
MFDSLDERIKQDEPENKTSRIIRYVVIAVVSVALFAGLYEAMRLLG